MDNNFKNLGISDSIIKSIEKMGFVSPTEVQTKAIPHILNKEDLIVMSKTGSGKTGAFGIPLLQSLDKDVEGPQALILTPTRELAVQVDIDLKSMSKFDDIKTTAVYGQHNINTEINVLGKGVSVVTGTPGRVFDHMLKKTLVTKNIEFLVLDEADRMLDMGFIDQVVGIIKKLPKNRVTLLFSATMPSEIKRICREYMKEPITIELESDTKTVDSIKQIYYRVDRNEKRKQLDRILKVEQPDSCMVFCNTRIEVDKVNDFLYKRGYVAGSIHGANTQNSRMRTIQKFKKGEIQILVATDVAARGIHIDDLTLVINYDVPVEKDSYVHRIGRTGRAGNGGRAISIVSGDDLMSLYDIEEHVGVMIDEEELPTDEYVNECIANYSGKWLGVKPAPKKVRTNEKAQSKRMPQKSSDKKPSVRESSRAKHSQSNRPKPKSMHPESIKHHNEKSKHSPEKAKQQHGINPKPHNISKPKQDHGNKVKHTTSYKDRPKRDQQTATKPQVVQKPVDLLSRSNVVDHRKKKSTKKSLFGRIGELFKK